MLANLWEHGFVRLDGVLADDLSVVNAARVSFGKRVEEMSDDDVGLVGYLMRHRHGTPFEHNAFRFHVACPIFVAREWQRHRIGSFNEMSSRYSVLEPRFHYPDPEEIRTQVGKPGAYTYEPANDEQAAFALAEMEAAFATAWQGYEDMLSAGIAREVARNVLPLGLYTEFYWTVNARSLMNFLSLRNAQQALAEIRAYAVEIEAMFAETMPVTAAAFIENGRVAP